MISGSIYRVLYQWDFGGRIAEFFPSLHEANERANLIAKVEGAKIWSIQRIDEQTEIRPVYRELRST
jgi:hypothetical protein